MNQNQESFRSKLERVAAKRGFSPEEYVRRIRKISSGRRVCARPAGRAHPRLRDNT